MLVVFVFVMSFQVSQAAFAAPRVSKNIRALAGPGTEVQCPSGYYLNPSNNHYPSFNGCGSTGTDKIQKMARAVGKKFEDAHSHFEGCCNQHDVCYDTCRSGQKTCDVNFAKCLAADCSIFSARCTYMAASMVLGVKKFGPTCYQDAQLVACQCSPYEDGYKD